MPFANFDDWDDCIQTMTEEEGHDMDSAENICGALQAEEKSEHGDPEQLMDALHRGAGLIADVGVDLVSGVDVPAVDSKWVMTKDADGHDWRANSPILLSKADDEDARISYAAAMIPREPDKEGDVVATPTVESAAHDFLKQNGGVDTDHSLIDGEGEVVESWVLKEERTFDLPGGETETYGAGTWMTGIEWGKDAWERIQNGELTGLSIYGRAEHVQLDKSADCGCGCEVWEKQPEDDPCWEGYEMVGTKTDEFGNEVPNCVPVEEAEAKREAVKQLDIPLANESVVHLVYESQTAAEKASMEIGLDGDVHEHEFDGMTVFMPGSDHEEFVERYMELSEEESRSLTETKRQDGDTHKGADAESEGMASDQTGDGGGEASGDGDRTDNGGPTIGEVAASVDDLAETVASVKEAVETEKDGEQEAAATIAEQFEDLRGGDILDLAELAASRGVDSVMEAAEQAKADDEEDMDDEEDDEDEMEASADDAEKRADEANLEKGSDGRQTAAKGIADDSSGTGLSYQALAEQEAGE